MDARPARGRAPCLFVPCRSPSIRQAMSASPAAQMRLAGEVVCRGRRIDPFARFDA